MKYLGILTGMVLALAACSPEQAEEHASEHGTMGHAAFYAENHADDIAATITNTNRRPSDLESDATRHPADVLAVSQIDPGSTVMDLGAGGGYFTRLVAGLVGPEGHVTGQNPQRWVDRFGDGWPEVHGETREDYPNIDFVVTGFDDLGVEPGSLDAVTMMLVYHDTIFLPIDRNEMNAGIFAALKPGGLFLVTDHAGVAGATTDETRGFHRIDGELARAEILAAGFELVMESDVLHNPDDPHDTSVFGPDIRGHTDRFVYLFRKP